MGRLRERLVDTLQVPVNLSTTPYRNHATEQNFAGGEPEGFLILVAPQRYATIARGRTRGLVLRF